MTNSLAQIDTMLSDFVEYLDKLLMSRRLNHFDDG